MLLATPAPCLHLPSEIRNYKVTLHSVTAVNHRDFIDESAEIYHITLQLHTDNHKLSGL